MIIKQLIRGLHLFGRELPSHIPIPEYIHKAHLNIPATAPIQSDLLIADAKTAGGIVREIFTAVEGFIRPGLSTQAIDDFVFNYCVSKSVYPSPLGYRGFPKSVCTSVNEVACHGIPNQSQILCPGDLLSVDVSIFTGRVHSDACRSYVVESHRNSKSTSYSTGLDTVCIRNARFLCQVAESCRDAGVNICAPGRPFEAIATAISNAAERHGCRVVVGIHGHGIGSYFHGPPEILHSIHELPHFNNHIKMTMQPGHIFTIEPCIALQTRGPVRWKSKIAKPVLLNDGWTIVTTDRALTAQFEHTVLIVDNGHLVLT